MRAGVRLTATLLALSSLTCEPAVVLAANRATGWLAAGLCPTYTGDSGLSSTPWTGTVGLGVTVRVSPHRTIETGLVIERRALALFSLWAADGRYRERPAFERRVELDYLRVPLRLRVSIGSGRVVPSLHAGLEGALLLSAREIDTDRLTSRQYLVVNHVDRSLRDGVVALALGGRVGMRAGASRLFADLTYVYGISPVRKSAFLVEGSLSGVVDRGYRITVGIER